MNSPSFVYPVINRNCIEGPLPCIICLGKFSIKYL